MSNNQNAALLEILPEIEVAARRVAGRWSGLINKDDLEQEIALKLLEDRYAVAVRNVEEAGRNKLLSMIGMQLASEAAAAYEYFTGNFTYTPKEVRASLNGGALAKPGYALMEGQFVEHNESGRPEAAQAQQISVEGIDLRIAFERLDQRQRTLLVDRYVHGEDPPTDTLRKALNRAVDKLTQEMNRVRRRANMEYEGH